MSTKKIELENIYHERNRTSYKNAARDIIDYVLVYEENENHEKIRQIFERNLRETGLILTPLDRQDNKIFIKVYAPKVVLSKYCEIMKMRMPLKIADRTGQNLTRSNRNRTKHGLLESFLNVFKPDVQMLPEEKFQLTEHFSRDKSYLFGVDSEIFFPPSVRSMIVNFILSKERFTDDQLHDNSHHDEDEDNYGIAKLISLGVYEAAYPLHNDKRDLLLEEWGSVSKLFKIQPLDYIKDYFGVKISLYYAWIGFYSYMLVPASILGVICTMHGFITLSKDNISTEVCNSSSEDIVMCPQCDKHCDYWNLREICTFSFIVHIFDNSFTVVFAILMSLWSALYLNLWNRYSAKIIHRWGIADHLMQDNDLPTVQYLNSVSKGKGKCDRLQRVIFSMAVVIFWMALVLAIVLGLMFYRISLSTSEKIFGVKSWIVIITGSIFDLITILILNHFYDRLALWLTEKELHRTQNEFERSLTWKIYLFWFVNYYSSSIYVAFFKGKFIGRPGAYQKIFGFRQEECGPAGCIVDLFIQIATIMIGDLTFNNILEHLVPYVQKKIRSSKINSMQDDEEKRLISSRQWLQDLKLLYWGNNELTNEYLEMILQYGFVTLFVAAFPLAPLVALINNIFEIRMDAKKLLINYRRPVAQNAQNIGIWLTIMNMISRISILSNACIIAFSTNFIPQMFYTFVVNADNTNVGFFNHTLAYFDTSDFEPKVLPILSDYKNISICRYTDYRNPPWHVEKYDLSKFYWHVLAAKLIFVLMYQNIVAVLQMLVCWLIPEMPKKLRKSILDQALKTQKIVLMNTRAQENRGR